MKRWGAALGVTIATVTFTAYHIGVVPGGESIHGYLLIALCGFIFGVIYLKSGSILAVIIIHDLYDALFSLPRIFEESGPYWAVLTEALAVWLVLHWFVFNKDLPRRFGRES